MLVRDYMTRHPLMAEPTMSVVKAQHFMAENAIRHLPVVGDGKRLLGLVTRQSLLVDPHRLASLDMWEIARLLSDLTLGDVMIKAKDVITVSADATLEEASRIMVENKIGGLPVLEETIVTGILTETDLLAQLVNLLGGSAKGVRVTIRMPDRIGEFAKVTGALAAKGWGIYASGGVPAPKEPGYWDMVVKVRNVDQDGLVSVLGAIPDQRIVDSREM